MKSLEEKNKLCTYFQAHFLIGKPNFLGWQSRETVTFPLYFTDIIAINVIKD